MVNALEELTAETLSRDYVERRLEDWVCRIEDLFTRITAWCRPDWIAVVPRRRVRMNEEPMREVGLDPITLPVLDLRREGRPTVSITPRGLWIIGVNGRLDVTSQGKNARHHVVVDRAENFEPPDWRIYSIDQSSERRPLDRATFLSVL